jgi:hypothetical protein
LVFFRENSTKLFIAVDALDRDAVKREQRIGDRDELSEVLSLEGVGTIQLSFIAQTMKSTRRSTGWMTSILMNVLTAADDGSVACDTAGRLSCSAGLLIEIGSTCDMNCKNASIDFYQSQDKLSRTYCQTW